MREGMDRVSTLLLVQLSRDAPALTALLQPVGTKLLLTPAMSANILMLVKVTHITCCGCTYSFCQAILSYHGHLLSSPSARLRVELYIACCSTQCDGTIFVRRNNCRTTLMSRHTKVHY